MSGNELNVSVKALDDATETKLRAALRFSASRSVLSSEDERRILSALSPQPVEAEPVAWVIPGDDNGSMRGFIDAMAWEEGEFTRPLYASPQPVTKPAMGGFIREEIEEMLSIVSEEPQTVDGGGEFGPIESTAGWYARLLRAILSGISTGEAPPQALQAAAAEDRFRGFCGQLIDMFDFNKLEHSVCDEDMDLVEHIRAALTAGGEEL